MKTIYLLSKLTLVLNIRHAQAQIVVAFAGSGLADSIDGTDTEAAFNQPAGIRMSNSGNLYVADKGNAIIREIDTTTGYVSTNRDPKFNAPTGIAFDSSGYLYVADSGDSTIAKFDPYAPKDTLVVLASSSCSGIAFDGSGNFFITDPTNKRISKLTGTTLTTFKSLGTSEIPSDIAIDSYKNIYVSVNHQIIKFVKGSSTNIVRYGTGTAGFLDGTSKTAKFNNPKGIAVDSKGNIFICDYSNNRIRQILPDGTVRTMAGSEVNDDIAGLGTSAAFQGPQGITLSNDEKTLYVTTAGNRIRKITICEPGFYATASGCVQCSANTYSLFSGSTICCPAGWYARPGDSQCRFDCTTTSTNFGTCDGILRTTSYYTASAVNGGSSCTLYPKNIEPCANCKTTSTDLGSCDGSLRTITFFTEAAWNGGSACTSKTVTTFTCTLDTPRDVKLEGQNPEVKVEDPIEVKVEDPIEVTVDRSVGVENPGVKVEDPIEVKVENPEVKVENPEVKVKGKAGRTGKVRTSQAAVSKEISKEISKEVSKEIKKERQIQ